MKPFCLESAQRGEPIQAHMDGEWCDVKFVGLGYDDDVIVDHPSITTLRFTEAYTNMLRMAPKKRTVFANLYRTDTHPFRGHVARWFDTEEQARIEGRTVTAPFAIAAPIEIEV